MNYKLIIIIFIINITECYSTRKLVPSIDKYYNKIKTLCTKKAINDTNKEYNKKCLYYVNNEVLNNNCNDNMNVLNTYYSKKIICMNEYKDNIKTSYFIVIIFFVLMSLLSLY